MINNAREHIHHESRERESGYEPDSLEVVRTPELEVFTREVSAMLEKISHNDTVTMRDMRALKIALEAIRVSTGVETAPLAAFEESEEWRKNVNLCEQIAKKFYLYSATSKLTYVPEQFTEALASIEDDLVFNALPQLSVNFARAFALHHKWGLSLDGLTLLSDEAGEALGHRSAGQFKVLSLNGIKTLSEKAAEGLSRHTGSLSLCGLTSLTKEAGEALGRHAQGDLHIGGKNFTMTREIADGIAKHQGFLYIKEGLILDEAIEVLATHKGLLDLSALKTLSDRAAEYLGQHEGDLILSGLSEISDSAAQKLSSHKRGEVYLPNITTLSSIAAKALVRMQGTLHLGRDIDISEQTAKMLARKKSIEFKMDNGRKWAFIDQWRHKSRKRKRL